VTRSVGVVVQETHFVHEDAKRITIYLNNHPVCGFAAATPPIQEGRSFGFAKYVTAMIRIRDNM